MSTITDAVVPHGVGCTFVTDDYFVTDAYLTGLFGTCRFIGSGYIILHKNVKRMEMAEKMSEVVDGRGGAVFGVVEF